MDPDALRKAMGTESWTGSQLEPLESWTLIKPGGRGIPESDIPLILEVNKDRLLLVLEAEDGGLDQEEAAGPRELVASPSSQEANSTMTGQTWGSC